MPVGGSQNSQPTLDFLDTIGSSDRGDGLPLSGTAKALAKVGKYIIDQASANLHNKGHVATGETISSMKLVNFNLSGKSMSLDIEIIDTYKFIDQGVKGTKGGTGKYQFRNDRPSKKMALALLKWARKRAMSGKTKYKAKGKNEEKNKNLHAKVKSANNYKSLAYAIATKVKQNGIKPTKFFTNAVKAGEDKMVDLLGEGLKVDIINSLNEFD